MKTYRITLLIAFFFALAAFLNEQEPNLRELIKSSAITFPYQDSMKGNSTTKHKEAGLQEAYDQLSYILIGGAIVGGLLLIVSFKITRSKKIISIQDGKLTKQEEALGNAIDTYVECEKGLKQVTT